MRLIVLFSSFAISLGIAAAEPVLDERALLGVWKMVYAADAKQRPQYEPTSGFLIIMPGHKYYEIREECCDPAVFMDAPRSYRVEAGKVILSIRRPDGEGYERTLRYTASERVVFFDSLEDTAVTTPVLSVHENGSPNYGYGKVYP